MLNPMDQSAVMNSDVLTANAPDLESMDGIGNDELDDFDTGLELELLLARVQAARLMRI